MWRLLAVWGTSRSSQELSAFTTAELLAAWTCEISAARKTLKQASVPNIAPATVFVTRRLRLVWIETPELAQVAAAAASCVLLTSLIKVLASEPSLQAAVATLKHSQAFAALSAWSLRVVVDPADGVSKAGKVRRVTQELQQQGIATAPAAGQPVLCCLVLHAGHHYILGEQVAQGLQCKVSKDRASGCMQQAPATLQIEAAMVTARLAHVAQVASFRCTIVFVRPPGQLRAGPFCRRWQHSGGMPVLRRCCDSGL
ncbi:hypothetical protein WJX72_007359 [[Myrmecia] bisecta]|uniref:Uncharacterized protein n=1 Tax=[Myrmecia] bisecta TaxID=41462 RepID=A0AAW1PBI6_9CHLO